MTARPRTPTKVKAPPHGQDAQHGPGQADDLRGLALRGHRNEEARRVRQSAARWTGAPIFTEPQQGASYDDLLRIPRTTEELGFDAFFRSDHYLSMGDADGLPGPSDAWVSLAGLARETSRIRLGTLVSPATFREPGPLAITVAQVDQMSGGRVEPRAGCGLVRGRACGVRLGLPRRR